MSGVEEWSGHRDFPCGCLRSEIFPGLCPEHGVCVHGKPVNAPCLGCEHEGREAGQSRPGRFMATGSGPLDLAWYVWTTEGTLVTVAGTTQGR